MTWRQLTASLHARSSGASGDPVVCDVTYDSRRVTPGAVYVAIPGTKTHGDAFITDAVARGAAAVVSINQIPACTVPWIQVADPRRTVGELARTLWGVDTDGMTLVGITGTNGKTTIAHLFRSLLVQIHEPGRVWMLTTVGYSAGNRFLDAPNTTPESSDIFRLIGESPEQPSALVMEVSSHALHLHRVAGLSYDCAVFTNLTQDHLDFHHTMDEYYQAKKRLFTEYLKPTGTAAVNIDDPWGARLAREIAGRRTVTYGAARDADVRIAGWRCAWEGTEVDVTVNGATTHLQSRLVGGFNVANIAALCAGAVGLGVGLDRVRAMLDGFSPVVGRMERVPLDAGFAVVVDYAHTPDALDNVLSTARALTAGRLFCVFGCGGDRDRTKRPRMAEATVRHCDEIVVTSDNPRTEKPEAIIEEIMAGVPIDFPHWVIADRRAAIARALDLARPGDCVVIAGKGHETYQEINGVKHHFSDREVVEEAWNRRQAAAA